MVITATRYDNNNLVTYIVIKTIDDGNTEHTYRCWHNAGQVILGELLVVYDDQTHNYEQKSGRYVVWGSN
jgi:hypothetical protein